jgi:hypothetical protein
LKANLSVTGSGGLGAGALVSGGLTEFGSVDGWALSVPEQPAPMPISALNAAKANIFLRIAIPPYRI